MISTHGLVRHSLERLLETYCSRVVGFPNAETMLRQADLADDAIVLLEPDGMRPLAVQLAEILAKSPDWKVVLLLKSADETDFGASIRAGARGCLTQDTRPELIGHLLAVVQTGHLVWPATVKAAESFNSLSANDAGHRHSRRPPDIEERVARLSKREKEVLLLVGSGLGNKRIASAMGISDTTVRLHMRSIMKKLGIENRTQAAIFSLHARGLDA